MSQAEGQAENKVAEARPALTTLAARTDLPARVRHLLEGVLRLASSGLERPLLTTLDDVEAQLFRMAEQSRSNEQQQRCFEVLREVKRGRVDVAPRFMLALEDTLARFDQIGAAPATEPGPRSPASLRPELSLVDTRELEESLALQGFAARTEIRQAQILFVLGHRFAVLAARPILDGESLPIGPTRLGQALRYAAAALDLDDQARILLYRTFDRLVQIPLGALYETVNQYLIEQRILRHLRVMLPHSKGSPAAQDEAMPPPAPMTAGPMGAGHLSGGQLPSPGFAGLGTSADGPAVGRALPPDDRDSELFTTLRELLAGRRHALGLSDTPLPNSYVPSDEDVQAVLSALQARPPSPLMLNGKLVQRSVTHLKQDLLAHLRQRAPDGRAPQLAPEDADTIDLVGMLFDYIAKNTRPDGCIQALLTKLQVPLLRVALQDKSFFTRRSHPARQLLNAIAETGTHWVDDGEGPADRALVEKMQMVVDRVTREFDGNLDVFENLLADLSQHMHTLARKAEFTERRHVDAARGREKLELARRRAHEAIAERLAKAARPGKLVRTLLEQAWTDVLAITLLRQGELSGAYQKRLEVAERLLGLGGDAAAPWLRTEVETALAQVGYHQDDVQAVVKRLFLPEAAASEDAPSSNTEIALKLKSKPRLGEDDVASAKIVRPKPFAPDSAEARMLERLKTLPFGTWFEFRTNQQGDKVRRKLAWFSTLTGRCLFVNPRGVRADEKSLEQLAREVVVGEASIVEAEAESIVDRAWQAIVASLKSLIGGGAKELPAPA